MHGSAGLNFRESVQVGAQYVALEDEVHELAFANDMDQAGRLQLFDVMREGRGAYVVGLVQDAAGTRVVGGPDLLEDLIASRFGQGAGDPRNLPVRQSSIFGGCHDSKVNPIGFGCPGKVNICIPAMTVRLGAWYGILM